MTVLTVAALTRLKHEVIGNPSAKVQFARDETLSDVVALLSPSSCILPSLESCSEAAEIVASVACASPDALPIVLSALLNANASKVLLHAIASQQSRDCIRLLRALMRALRNVAIACAELVGPPLWGLSSEQPSFQNDAQNTLDEIFHIDSLDIFLPLVENPSPDIVLSVLTLIATCVRQPAHCSLVVNWRPPSERSRTPPRRGWEKPTAHQPKLSQFGSGCGYMIHQLLTVLKGRHAKLQQAALSALAALAKANESVASFLGRSIGDSSDQRKSPFALISSSVASRSTAIQLAGCLCITYIIHNRRKSEAFVSVPSIDGGLILTVIRVLTSIAENPKESSASRSKACYVLSFLVADDKELQRVACDSGTLQSVISLLQSLGLADFGPWLEEEPEDISRLREAALAAIANLAMLRDDVRRDLIEPPIIPLLHASLTHSHVAVRYSACQCARALTRSVHVLRTSVVDSRIGTRLFEMMKDPGEDRRVRNVALAGLCNLLSNFSPFREIMFNQGGIQQIIMLLDTDEEAWRINALWAVKNVLHNSKLTEKESVMADFGWERLTRYILSDNEGVKEQALTILRNLAIPVDALELLMTNLGEEVILQALEAGLESESTDILVQTLGALNNLLFGTYEFRSALLVRPRVMIPLKETLQHPSIEVRRAAGQCVLQLVKAHPRRHMELREHGFDVTLRLMSGSHSPSGSVRGTKPQMGFEEDRQVRQDVKQALFTLDFLRE